MTTRHPLAKPHDRPCVIAETFARENPSPPTMKLSRNRLPRAQDQDRMPPATSFFGPVSIATRKRQTRTEVDGFAVGQI
jgi:hypothetical protein